MVTKAAHIRLQGITYSVNYPTIWSGHQSCLPVPSYSMLLGLCSTVAGREITEIETNIGFEMQSDHKNVDYEATFRWKTDSDFPRLVWKKGSNTAVRYRDFYTFPTLDLYLTNLELISSFEHPVDAPRLGRTQDLAWISIVEEVELNPVNRGEEILLGNTTIPAALFLNQPLDSFYSGWLLNLPEGSLYSKTGTRTFKKIVQFISRECLNTEFILCKAITFKDNSPAFYVPSNFVSDGQKIKHAIYLHQWDQF